MTDDDVMLSVRNLSKTFTLHNQGGVRLRVLEDASLDVRRGECLVLAGRSGAGKSTLLRSMYANYLPQQGQVLVRHRGAMVDLVGAEPRLVLEVRRETLGYVSQFLRVIPRVGTLDLVMEPLRRRAMDAGEARQRAEAAPGPRSASGKRAPHTASPPSSGKGAGAKRPKALASPAAASALPSPLSPPTHHPSSPSSISRSCTPFRCAAPSTATIPPSPPSAFDSRHASRMLLLKMSFLVSSSAFRNSLDMNTTSATSSARNSALTKLSSPLMTYVPVTASTAPGVTKLGICSIVQTNDANGTMTFGDLIAHANGYLNKLTGIPRRRDTSRHRSTARRLPHPRGR